MQFTKPIPYTEALDKLGKRSVIGSKLNSEEWSRVPVAIRERAIWSSTIESVRFLQRHKERLEDFIAGAREDVVGPDGVTRQAIKVGSRAQFIDLMREEAIAEGIGPMDPADAGGLKDITSETRLGLIFDIQTQAAHDYGSWKQGQDPDILSEFPAQRFIRVVDVEKPRELHRENEGVVRLKSDLDFWIGMNAPEIGGFGVPWGPWGFGSGMDVEDVDRAEAEQLGLLAPGEAVKPAEGDLNDRLKASTRNLDPEMVDWLRSNLGSQVEITGGEARLKRPAPARPRPGSPAAPARPRRSPPAAVPMPPVVAPAPPAPVTPAARPLSAPVSAAVKPEGSGRHVAPTNQALAAIDEVHGDGKLPNVPVRPLVGTNRGHLMMTPTGEVVEIAVRPSGDWPALTVAHEVGHLLDLKGIGSGRQMATSLLDGPLAPVMAAIRASKAHAELLASVEKVFVPSHRAYIRHYLLSPEELWARSYAQFIATRASDPDLRRQLARAQEEPGGRQWQDTDFTPIADAIEAVFKTFGWL